MKIYQFSYIAFILISQILCGCSGYQSIKTNWVKLDSPFEKKFYTPYKSNIPMYFQILHSVTFAMGPYNFSALGFTEIDRAKKTFQLVGMNPMGIKLFEIVGDEQKVDCPFSVGEFKKHPQFADFVGTDIRRIYFNIVPPENATVFQSTQFIKFEKTEDEMKYEYIFDTLQHQLVEKTCFKDNHALWQVKYKNYQSINSMKHPFNISFTHFSPTYTIDIKLMEVKK